MPPDLLKIVAKKIQILQLRYIGLPRLYSYGILNGRDID